MTFTLAHSVVATGTNNGADQVSVNAWNANHTITGTSGTILFNNAGTLDGFGAWTSGTRTLQLGAADSASPGAQTLGVSNVVAGTTSTAGADWTLQGSFSTGASVAGNILFNTGWKAPTVGTAYTVTFAQPIGGIASQISVSSSNSNGLVPGQPVQFTTTGTLPAPFALATTYYWTGFLNAGNQQPGLLDLIGRSNVALTVGGAGVIQTNAGSGTHTMTTVGGTSVNGPLVVNSEVVPPAAAQQIPYPFGTLPTLKIGPVSISGSQTTPALTINRTDSSNYFSDVDAGLFLNMWRNGGGTGEKNTYFNISHNGQAYFTVRKPGSDAEFVCGTVAGAVGTGGCIQQKIYTSAFIVGVGAVTGGLLYCLPSTQIYGKSDGTGGIAQYGYYGFTSSTQQDGTVSAVTSPDTMIFREAAGIIAQRDGFTGTNAQSFRVYNTADNLAGGLPTNRESAVFDWKITSNVLTIGTQANGTGTVRDFALVKGANTFFTSATTTVGSLPAPGTKGRRHFVTDATATTFATIVAGTGANNVPVYDDGTNWRIG